MKKMCRLLRVLLSLVMLLMLIPTAAKAATTVTVTVKKTDPAGNPLAGATFSLTGVGDSVNQDYTAISGQDGFATFTNVAEGSYELFETEAPKGYVAASLVYTIRVYDGQAYLPAEPVPDTMVGTEDRPYEIITFVNEERPTYTVTFQKNDEAGNPLTGAVFLLTAQETSEGQDFEATSDKDGRVTFRVWDGYYTLSEKQAPDGYLPSDVTYDISVSNDGVYILEKSGDEFDFQPFENVVYVNQPIPTYPITVKKTDKDGNPLAGAVFTLTGTGDSAPQTYEAVSDKDGFATFSVREGSYTLAEKNAPKGYIRSDKTYTLAVFDGKVHRVDGTGDNPTYAAYQTITFINEKVQPIPPTGDTDTRVLWAILLAGISLPMLFLCQKHRKTTVC